MLNYKKHVTITKWIEINFVLNLVKSLHSLTSSQMRECVPPPRGFKFIVTEICGLLSALNNFRFNLLYLSF